MKKYFLLMMISSVLFSCYEDKGNYEYESKEVITITNIEKEYTRTAYASILEIDPLVSPPQEGDHEYAWYLYSNTPGGIVDTISNALNLNYEVNIPQGQYELTLRVKNSKTLYCEYFSTKFSVITDFSLGWYVQKELDGDTELDLHKLTGELSENLIAKIQGKSLRGKPVSLNIIGGFTLLVNGEELTSCGLSVVSEADLQLLSTVDMSVIYNHDNLFFNAPIVDEKSYRMFSNGRYNGYISDKGFYFCSTSGFTSGRFGSPVKMNDGSSVSFGNNFIYTNSSMCSGMLYDDLNQRFLGVHYNGSFIKFTDKDANNKPTEYTPNGTGCKILFLGRSGKARKASALLENVTTGKKYIYNLNTSYLETSKATNPIIQDAVYEVPSTSLISSSTIFCQNETVPYLYFANGNKLGTFDNLKGIELPNIVSFNSDETITSIQHLYWTASFDSANKFDHIIVSTTNGENYTIYMFNILAGQPDGEPVKVLKGKGKPKQVQFFTSIMNKNSYKFYPL